MATYTKTGTANADNYTLASFNGNKPVSGNIYNWDGGNGTDKLTLGGSGGQYTANYLQANFTINPVNASGVIVVTGASSNGTSITLNLTSVETLVFVDGSVTLSYGAVPPPPPPPADTTAPIVSSYSPSDAAAGVAVGSNIVLTFSEAIQKGSGSIVIHSDSATGTAVATYDAATSGNLSVSGNTLTINPTADLAAGTQYFVTLDAGSIKDLAGNSYAGTTTYDFTTVPAPPADTTPPIVSTFNPSDAAAGVAVGSDIVLTFSEAIQKGSGSIVIHSGSATGTAVATYDAATSGNLSVSGNTLTINPTADLAAGTQYFVTLDAGSIKDLAGNSYAGTTTYDFTTVAAPATDTTAPIVSTFNPSDAAAGVAVGSNIVLTFSEAVQKGSGSIVIHSSSATGTAVATYDAATSGNLSVSGNTLTINPTADLAAGTQYFVTLDAGSIKDLAGNSYAGTTTYDFTTVAAPAADTTSPTVSTFNPSDAAPGVAVGSDIVLTFSEAVQKGSGSIVIHSGSATGAAVATYDAATSGNLSVSGNTLTINPSSDLAAGTHYFVTLDAGSIKDLAGNSYAGTTAYDFITAATLAADTIAPTVSSFSPSDAATGVAVGSDIVLTFSEAVQKGSGSIVIHSGSATGAAVATYDAATSGNLSVSGNTLTINPSSDLANGTEYFVTLDAGSIKDLAGNSYAAQTGYHFVTNAHVMVAGSLESWEYLASWPDLMNWLGTDVVAAAAHYNNFGAAEHRSITFDAWDYLASNVDLMNWLGSDVQKAAEHYILNGRNENRSFAFDAATYLAANQDLALWLGTDYDAAAKHYIEFGRFEMAQGLRPSFAELFLTPPSVIDYAPVDAAFGVPVSSNIVLTFSEAIQKGVGTVTIHTDSATGVTVASYDMASSGNLSVSGSTLTINPSTDLASGTHYFVTLDAGSVKDLLGNSYVGTSAYDFTTAPAADTTAPTVSGYSPAGAATGVTIGSDIVLTFSEAIQRGSGTIVIHSDSPTGSPIATFDAATSGNLSMSGSNLTINPSTDLADGTHYFVTLDAGSVKDFAGNSYTGTSAYDFTTAPAADTTAPTVSVYSPAGAATGVAIGSDIVLTFSEAIQRGSGTIVIHSDSPTGSPIATFDAAKSGNLSVSGSTLTINPSTDLANGTHYFVTLDAGSVKDLAGNSYTGTFAYDFTTEAVINNPADTTPPVVTEFHPADATTDVDVSSDIVLTFSEAIQKGSGTIVIHRGSPTGTEVATYDAATSGNVTVSDNMLIINPTGNLANSTHYYVTVSEGSVKDLVGNSYAGTSSYDFSTVASDNSNHDNHDSHDSHAIALTGIYT